MAWMPEERVKATIANTTQLIPLVECETRAILRDHILERLAALRPRRLRETWYTDTFFVSVRSSQGHTCFQLFVAENHKFLSAYPMKREANGPASYSDFVRFIGAPETLKRDN